MGIKCFGIKKNFNPLPRKEGDHLAADKLHSPAYFNPLPRKEGDVSKKISTGREKNFNPLPRKEGDWLVRQ